MNIAMPQPLKEFITKHCPDMESFTITVTEIRLEADVFKSEQKTITESYPELELRPFTIFGELAHRQGMRDLTSTILKAYRRRAANYKDKSDTIFGDDGESRTRTISIEVNYKSAV